MANNRLRTLSPQDVIALQQFFTPPSSLQSWIIVKEALEDDNAAIQIHRCACGLLVIFDKDVIEKMKRDFLASPQATCWHLQGMLTSLQLSDGLARRNYELIGYAVNAELPELLQSVAATLLPIDGIDNTLYSALRLEAALTMGDYQDKTRSQKSRDYSQQAFSVVHRLIGKTHRANSAELEKFAVYYADANNIKPMLVSLGVGAAKAREMLNIKNAEAYYEVSKVYRPDIRWESEKRAIELQVDAYAALIETTGLLEMVYGLVRIASGLPFAPHPFDGESVLMHGKMQHIDHNKTRMKEKILQDCYDRRLRAYIIGTYDYAFRNATAGHNDYDINLDAKTIHSRKDNKVYSFNYLESHFQRITALIKATLNLARTAFYLIRDVEFATMGIHAIAVGDPGSSAIMIFQHWSNGDLDPKNKIQLGISAAYDIKRRKIRFHFTHQGKKVGAGLLLDPGTGFLRIFEEALSTGYLNVIRQAIGPRTNYFSRFARHEITLGDQRYFVVGIHQLQRMTINRRQISNTIARLRAISLDPEPDGIPIEDFFRRPVNN